MNEETIRRSLAYAFEEACRNTSVDAGEDPWDTHRRGMFTAMGITKSVLPIFHLLFLRNEGFDLLYRGARFVAHTAHRNGSPEKSDCGATLVRVLLEGFDARRSANERQIKDESICESFADGVPSDELVAWFKHVMFRLRVKKALAGFVPVVGPIVSVSTDLGIGDRMYRQASTLG